MTNLDYKERSHLSFKSSHCFKSLCGAGLVFPIRVLLNHPNHAILVLQTISWRNEKRWRRRCVTLCLCKWIPFHSSCCSPSPPWHMRFKMSLEENVTEHLFKYTGTESEWILLFGAFSYWFWAHQELAFRLKKAHIISRSMVYEVQGLHPEVRSQQCKQLEISIPSPPKLLFVCALLENCRKQNLFDQFGS